MDDFLDSNNIDNSEKTPVDRKRIVIRHRKIKRVTRTFLYNIDHWLGDDAIAQLAKQVKKKLATSSQVVTDEEGTALTFNGDHTQVILDLIIKYSNGSLTEESFE